MTRTGDSFGHSSGPAVNHFFTSIIILLSCILVIPAFAATSIEIRQSGSAYANAITVVKNQTVTLEIWADVEDDSTVGVAFYVSVPVGSFEIVDQNSNSVGIQPFISANSVFGSFNENRTYKDTIEFVAYDMIDGAASLGGSFFKTGVGLVATVQLRAISDTVATVPVAISYTPEKFRDTRHTLTNLTSKPFDIRRSVNIQIDLPTGLIDLSEAGMVKDYALQPNYPNPFNPQTTIRYAIPQAGPVRLAVYNLLGQQIATLVNAHQAIGNHQAVWNGQDDGGRPAPSGMYIYRIETADFAQARRMLLLK